MPPLHVPVDDIPRLSDAEELPSPPIGVAPIKSTRLPKQPA